MKTLLMKIIDMISEDRLNEFFKNKIRAFYTKREKDENLSRGADMFEKALRRRNLPFNETLDEYFADFSKPNESLRSLCSFKCFA